MAVAVSSITRLGLFGLLVSPLYHREIKSVTEQRTGNPSKRMLSLAEPVLTPDLRLAHRDTTIGEQRDYIW